MNYYINGIKKKVLVKSFECGGTKNVEYMYYANLINVYNIVSL